MTDGSCDPPERPSQKHENRKQNAGLLFGAPPLSGLHNLCHNILTFLGEVSVLNLLRDGLGDCLLFRRIVEDRGTVFYVANIQRVETLLNIALGVNTHGFHGPHPAGSAS